MSNGDNPAFPRVVKLPNGIEQYEGLTKREWFAGRADMPWNAVMESLRINEGIENPTVDEMVRYRAQLAFRAADAMLKEAEHAE